MTTIIVVFSGTKVPNYVRYGSVLMKCHTYQKQVDVCHQSARIGHRKDVCPSPTDRVFRVSNRSAGAVYPAKGSPRTQGLTTHRGAIGELNLLGQLISRGRRLQHLRRPRHWKIAAKAPLSCTNPQDQLSFQEAPH
ncbi:hypothetical protein HPB48_016328 [Haemaphysalis longicornis]|uniref:Uncharacterized protein n=1 Tax=Haemaphysalis longicornis TaxID=44386 RepID=A0A9J6G7P3_HAELO|nr:hypothetical protein HPB48_016328 [Haemaphysalis longicornis]